MDWALHNTSHESLEVGATPVVRRFLERLQLKQLFRQYVPPNARRAEELPIPVTLCALVTNLLLARCPLYALPEWLARRVPEHLGLERALDRLYKADRASMLTALVVRAVREFRVQLGQMHNDTTTVTFSGAYRNQEPAEEP